MLTQVKLAISQLDNSTNGALAVRFVIFSSSAFGSGTFATAAAANAYLDSLNPSLGGVRPNTIGTQTDFTAAITQTLATYPADPTATNLVFFVSDGNPNEQLGTGGNSLADATATAWNTFVDTNNVNVTAIGVGSAIDLARLQDVDLNNAPNNVPILIADFTTLITALTSTITPASISGDVDANDQFGADGGRILSIVVNGITYTWDGATTITASSGPAIAAGTSITAVPTGAGGTLTFNFATGAWTYTPPVSVAATTVETFNYTIIDGDGDKMTVPLSITVVNDPVPTTAPRTATVDDDALSGGIAAGTGDLDANATEAPVTASEAIYSGTLGITYGADGAGTTTFAQLHGSSISVGTETATLTWAGATNTLTATGPRGVIFTVQLTNPATGAYSVTLVDNVLHTAGGTENDAAVALTYKVSDGNGTTATGVLNITFDDDTPTLGPIQNQQANNDPNQAVAIGTLHFAPGADGAGAAMTITADMTGITYGGQPIKTVQSGNVLTGYSDANGNNTFDAGDTAVFNLVVDPAAGTSGQYIFDLLQPLDPTVTPTPIGGSSSFGAGPTGYQILQSATAQDLAVVSGYHMGGTFNEANWLLTGSAGPASNYTVAGVNGSTSGWGIDNNNFNGTDEMFVWDFGSQATRDPDGAGAFVPPTQGPDVLPDPPVEVQMPNISFATFDFVGYVTGDDIKYVVHFTDGSFASGTIPDANLDSGPDWTYTAPGGKFIADIEMFTSGTGSGKVDLVSVGVQSSSIDKTIPFTLTLNDGDGDPTASTAFSVRVATGLVPLTPALPIVLDLTGNGLHFQSLAAGIAFDYLGNGSPLKTAWAGKDDGILAIDLDGNGKIDSGREFIFGSNGQTDLQGLAALYDSNKDGVLDARDAEFAKFGVWQDADSDGFNDAGEFKSLADLGITSINLTSDGKVYAAAGGDVTVHGETTFTRADGTTGVAADASFAVAGEVGAAAGDSASHSSTADVMASLLSQGALDYANSLADSSALPDDAAQVTLALGDSEAGNFIDNLVNSLSGGNSGWQSGDGGGGDDGLAALLAASVGNDTHYAALPFDLGHDAQAEALAAA